MEHVCYKDPYPAQMEGGAGSREQEGSVGLSAGVRHARFHVVCDVHFPPGHTRVQNAPI